MSNKEVTERAQAKCLMRTEEKHYKASVENLHLLKMKHTINGVVWEDEKNKRSYQRIVGGAAWPGPESYTPTCHMAILGEDVETDIESGRTTIWILFEESSPSIEDLLWRVVNHMEAVHCLEWVMPTEDPGYIRVEQWVRERRRKRLAVPQVVDTPIDSFLELNALMQARTVTTKSFFFGKESMAAAAYISIPDADFRGKLSKYPQVGAVLYPLGFLDTTRKRSSQKSFHIPAEGGY